MAFAAASPSVALAHWPIRRPALRLSVAKVASAASIGSSGVSSTITIRPASRAFWMVGTIALTSRTARSQSPWRRRRSGSRSRRSGLRCRRRTRRRQARRSRPSSSALACAPSRILTKKGLVFGLGDQADDRLVLRDDDGHRRTGHEAEHHGRSGRDPKKLTHENPPTWSCDLFPAASTCRPGG